MEIQKGALQYLHHDSTYVRGSLFDFVVMFNRKAYNDH